jgi:hypothetical protein
VANEQYKDPTKLYVAAQRCSQCLFTKDRVVPNARAGQIVNECMESDQHFVCHKGSLGGVNLHCRGFYDFHKSAAVRLAEIIGVETVLVDADALEQEV